MGVKNEMTHATENTAASVKKNSNATFQGRQSSLVGSYTLTLQLGVQAANDNTAVRDRIQERTEWSSASKGDQVEYNFWS